LASSLDTGKPLGRVTWFNQPLGAVALRPTRERVYRLSYHTERWFPCRPWHDTWSLLPEVETVAQNVCPLHTILAQRAQSGKARLRRPFGYSPLSRGERKNGRRSRAFPLCALCARIVCNGHTFCATVSTSGNKLRVSCQGRHGNQRSVR
jgi:hypothetical protein